MIPLLASLYGLDTETIELGPNCYVHTSKPLAPIPGVHVESMQFDITRSGRLTVTGTVKVKGGYARLQRLGIVGRMSRGMRKHVRRVKAGRRRG